MTSTTFWAEHQVGGPYHTLEESERALAEREKAYPGLYDLMPVALPGKTVLDYGCGPGHDTILFLQHGARRVWYADTSPLAIRTTRTRLRLHGLARAAASSSVTFLPLVEHVHCAGVLHHVEEPDRVLRSLARSLLPDGELRLMVYDGETSERTQSDVPITHWWTHADVLAMAADAGLEGEYVGGYPCDAPWRPNCYAACYRMWPA